MFDVSFSELMLIGVIALIVIGPERLPKVARTVGHLLGRAQRYVSDVKTDIQREMDLDELSNLKGQMEDAAKSVKSSMEDATSSLKAPLDEAQKALKEASSSVENLVDSAKADLNATDGATGSATDSATDSKPEEFVHQPVSEPPVGPVNTATAEPAPDASRPASGDDPDTLPLPGFTDTNKTKTGTPT